jgi:hypothetical protein
MKAEEHVVCYFPWLYMAMANEKTGRHKTTRIEG